MTESKHWEAFLFTAHAEQRLQDRFISRSDVETAIATEEAYSDAEKVFHAVNENSAYHHRILEVNQYNGCTSG